MLWKLIGSKSSIEVADKKSLIGLGEGNRSDTSPKVPELRNQLSLLKWKDKNTPLEGNAQ